MGGSSKQGKDTIVEWLKNESPNIILDLGCGSGTYYDLFVDRYKIFTNATWIGIEAWAPTIVKYNLDQKYNKVINNDIRNISWSEFKYSDITFMGDVLEHMTTQEAVQVVENVMSISSIGIISIPTKHWPQGIHDENPYEIHIRDDWTHDEVMTTFDKFIKKGINHGKIGTYYLTN